MPELIQLILEMKRGDPRFGIPRIAQEIARTFENDIDKDAIRRVLTRKFHPDSVDGPHGSLHWAYKGQPLEH